MSLDNQDMASSACAARDPFGRPVKSLRLSVTQRCDLACSHCHREGQLPSVEEMTPSEIERLVRVGSSLGIRKVKLTGGEPLVRDDIADIITRISPLVKEVSLTTNGLRLEGMAGDLKAAGLRRVNVSLHSLNAETYQKLCGRARVEDVVQGIRTAIKAGLSPVKVNMVVLKAENECEITKMMDFCAQSGAVLQLIEYEADRNDAAGEEFGRRFVSLRPLEDALSKQSIQTSVNELHRRRRYDVRNNGSFVSVEFVRPMHNTEFCSNCTRIRMSSDGKLKPCLLDKKGQVDVLTPLRAGATDDELRGLFKAAVANRRPYWS